MGDTPAHSISAEPIPANSDIWGHMRTPLCEDEHVQEGIPGVKGIPAFTNS